MNRVIEQRENLKEKNYILKNGVGWIGVTKSKIDHYKSLYGTNFNIVLFGDSLNKNDYYIIPYQFIEDLLIDSNLSISKKPGKIRWLAWTKNQQIKIGNIHNWRDISKFYNISISENLNIEIDCDFSAEDEKRLTNSRPNSVKKFRTSVLNNFDSQCCLTDAAEEDLLEASHIIGWADEKEIRLDPKNGLCLSIAYHKLFDRGYFTFDDEFRVLVTDKIEMLSEETRRQLQAIRGKRLKTPRLFPISKRAISHHRNNIFEKRFYLE